MASLKADKPCCRETAAQAKKEPAKAPAVPLPSPQPTKMVEQKPLEPKKKVPSVTASKPVAPKKK
ncbi:unnamed protein product [Camellia sinensis]